MKRYVVAPLRRSWNWLYAQEPILLAVLLLLAVCTWSFIEIADGVMEGDTHGFDKWVVRSMRQVDDPAVPVGPRWVHEMGRDATAFGGIAALLTFTAFAAGYLWIDHKVRMAALLVVSSLGGVAISSVLKHLFSRPRPDIVPHLSIVYTSSFPSGHSMLSAVVYLTLGSLLASVIPRRALKIYVLAVAVFLTVIVGVSRVYLGVHYPTDVLAGWIAGLAWALLCWVAARWLQRHHRVETASTPQPMVDEEPSDPADVFDDIGSSRGG